MALSHKRQHRLYMPWHGRAALAAYSINLVCLVGLANGQGGADRDITFVTNATALQTAFDERAPHIHLTAHMDLTELEVANPDSDGQRRASYFRGLQTTDLRSLTVRRFGRAFQI